MSQSDVAARTASNQVSALLERRQDLLIDGERVAALAGRTFATVNPATGDPVAQVAEGDSEDIDRAVASARQAFGEGVWHRKVSPRDRSRLLLRLCDLIEGNLEELAQLEAIDAGKPITHARRDDLPVSLNYLRYYSTWPDKLSGETRPVGRSASVSYTVREPVGVCGGIIPWNYPLMMAVWKIGPALASGNSLILKPAEQTPLTALRLGELALEAGIPPGVLNVVPGLGHTAGAALAAHAGVDKLAFTGSWQVGQEIVKASAGNLKRVSLELGGKSPHILFADADLSRAVPDAADGIFYNQGQDCSAGSRIFAQKEILDDVLEGLATNARGLVLGDTFDSETNQGPLITAEQRDRVASYVDGAREAGIEVLCGGDRPALPGYYYEPTVLGPTENAAKVAREEIFGPVVVVIPFDDEEDAVLQGNDTMYGLAAGMWTRDIDRAMRVAKRLRAGRVWINGYNLGDPTTPFGGFKMSGYGRENGREVFDLYTEVKNVWISWAES